MNEKKSFEFDQAVADQLDRLFRTDVLKNLRKEYFKLFDVQPGDHILDSGTGTGANAMALVEHLLGKCKVTGIDTSEPMLAIGQNNLRTFAYPGSIDLRPGDGHELPFSDSTFDGAMIIQVLEYSKDPLRMLGETRRVLKSNGKMFVADTDWDTIVWNSDQKDLTRRVVHQWSDHEADGWQGRKIYEYLKRAGLRDIQGGVYPLYDSSFAPESYAFLLTKILTDYLERSEKMSAMELRNWIEDLNAKARDGHFYFSLNRYAFVGRK
jgi:ubiquinone/menaquinone biosynthesis C-methylase UbiE